VLGANQFSDLSLEEFKALHVRGYTKPGHATPLLKVHTYNGEDLAVSVDWRTKGAVTPIKDQGQCGSCWAFSTVAGLEGAWQITTGSLVSMSEQQFVDCSTLNHGCMGGSMDLGLMFAQMTAVATEASYPYNANWGDCQHDFSPAIPQGGVTGLTDVDQSVEALKSALNLGPVSIGIEADQDVFHGYIGGVITSGCGSNVDHGVTAVGYTSDYFIVKNSWGVSWGEEGYVNIAGDQCGITTGAVFPLVTANPPPCHDNKDAGYCADLVQEDLCDVLGGDCLKTCGCCDDPTPCGGAVLV